MLSLVKSTLSISLALFAVTSAAPQDLAYGSGSDLSYSNGGTGTLCSGPDCLPTQVPVSPITIVPETDILPINNVQPVFNVFPPNINDYNFDYNYNNYGNYGALGGLIGGGLLPLSSALGASGLGTLAMGMLDPITTLQGPADDFATFTSAIGLDILAASGAQDRLGPGLNPLFAPDSVGLPLGIVGGGVPAMMGVPASLDALAGSGPTSLGGLSAGAPAMVNPGDLGALSAGMPMMTSAPDVGSIIAALQDALRGVATGVQNPT
ncbi:hypothetical protein BGZ89_000765 [Linnemannia elongata]|nr:hypothetical protein BGZ89_000765 [Linnemannia elongata]